MPRESDAPDDASLSVKCAAVLGIAFTVASFALWNARAGVSVFIGAAIAVANLLTMRAIIRALIREPEGDEEEGAEDADHKGAGRRGGTAWGIFALLKIFLLFGGVWILLTKGLVDPIPLVVGYGVLPLGIAGSAMVRSLRPRRR